jgi:hypothetical protein
VLEADNTTKNDMVVGEAEGDGWRLEVKYDPRKLDRWVECVIGLNY